MQPKIRGKKGQKEAGLVEGLNPFSNQKGILDHHDEDYGGHDYDGRPSTEG